MCVAEGHSIRALKHLDHSLVFIDFNNTANLFFSVIHTEFDDLLVGSVFNALQDYKRAVDLA